ncbi:MAG: nucleoside hydrolase [Rhizobiaceae bacterium]|nr:nucleoside hydrolase [Rhizobiaceae bacterium]
MTKPIPVIIDCDPGQDDAIMLFLALNAPELDIRGIVAVGGNVPLARTRLNLAMLVETTRRTDVKLYSGAIRPMVRDLVTAEEVHGITGINGFEFFEPEMKMQDIHGVDFIVENLRGARDNEITIIATGPLTNIAMALVKAPDIADKIKQIVIMGGASFEAGNVTPSAEFNIYVDPHACDVVLKCQRPIIMFGLDVTHKVMTNPARVAAIRALGNPVSEAAADMLDYFGKHDSKKYSSGGAPLHDPCTVAWLLKPELFELKPCHVAVETGSELTMGHTAVDFWQVTDNTANVQWAYDVNADRFFDLLTERLEQYQ